VGKTRKGSSWRVIGKGVGLVGLAVGVMWGAMWSSQAQNARDPLPEGNSGIAARYPADKGIENDPSVIFAEKFDEGSLEKMWKRWEDVRGKGIMSFSPLGSVALAESGMDQCRRFPVPGEQGKIGLHRRKR